MQQMQIKFWSFFEKGKSIKLWLKNLSLIKSKSIIVDHVERYFAMNVRLLFTSKKNQIFQKIDRFFFSVCCTLFEK